MPTPVVLPKLDMTMAEGTLIRWLRQEGDRVAAGDPLFEIEADKTTMDIDAPAAGVLQGIAYPGGSRLPVGTVLAYLLAEGEALPEPALQAPEKVRATPAARRLARTAAVDLAAVRGSGEGGRIHAADVAAAAAAPPPRITPAARRVATALAVDLATVQGTGVGGKVMRADIEQVAAAEGAAAPGRESVAGVRAVIARRLTESWQQAPHVTLTLEADAGELERLRQRLSGAGTVKLTYNVLISYLTARALLRHPRLNSTWDGGDLLRHGAVHLGIAVDAPQGLVVPVVRHAETLGLTALAAAQSDLVDRAAAGSLQPSDLQGGTFTLSNLGGLGIEAFTPLLNPPQVAVLGVGAIIPKVVPAAGVPAVRSRLTFSLTFDHRALDGADGARFLVELRGLIEAPERVLL